MEIRAVDEYNEHGHLIYLENYIGAYVRGREREEALNKFRSEIKQYAAWSGDEIVNSKCSIIIVQEKISSLQVSDADSDVLFNS